MSSSADFILASASPRRAELLRQIGARFLVAPTDLDESHCVNERPIDYVQRMAQEKAQAGWLHSEQKLPVMGADTIVVLGNTIFGKPSDKQNAIEMLTALSGNTHKVFSAVSICRGTITKTELSETRVTFRDLSLEEIDAYWQTDEPRDKAGAYGIQGLGSVFVSLIEGSYSTVVGLPITETTQLMSQFDLPWWQEI